MTAPLQSRDDDGLVQRVVEEVAAATDTSPLELSPPLYEVVDPDALVELVGTGGTSGVHITFRYRGCTVQIDERGTVDASVAGSTTSDETRLTRNG